MSCAWKRGLPIYQHQEICVDCIVHEFLGRTLSQVLGVLGEDPYSKVNVSHGRRSFADKRAWSRTLISASNSLPPSSRSTTQTQSSIAAPRSEEHTSE